MKDLIPLKRFAALINVSTYVATKMVNEDRINYIKIGYRYYVSKKEYRRFRSEGYLLFKSKITFDPDDPRNPEHPLNPLSQIPKNGEDNV